MGNVAIVLGCDRAPPRVQIVQGTVKSIGGGKNKYVLEDNNIYVSDGAYYDSLSILGVTLQDLEMFSDRVHCKLDVPKHCIDEVVESINKQRNEVDGFEGLELGYEPERVFNGYDNKQYVRFRVTLNDTPGFVHKKLDAFEKACTQDSTVKSHSTMCVVKMSTYIHRSQTGSSGLRIKISLLGFREYPAYKADMTRQASMHSLT